MTILNAKKIFLFILLTLGLLLVGYPRVVKADECDDIPSSQDRIQEKINCLSSKVSQLSSQSNTLKNQIAQFDYQIKLTTLKIQDTEEKIRLLGGRIGQLEDSLDSLTIAFSSRALETYKMSRLESNFSFLFNAPDLGEAVSRFHYLQRIQEADRSLLEKLQTAQTTYEGQKADQETLQAELKKQQASLNTQKVAKAALLAATQSDEKKYQSLLSQARAQLAAFSRFVTRQGGASILGNQTKCDSWGCYYNQRDGQWGNIGMGGSSYTMANYGCLVTSVAMIASHQGKDIKPGDIATVTNAFVPGTGYLYHSFSVNGVNVTISSVSRGELDQRLGSGPVIAGLYGGPDHFIVILRKEGDNYIMHDPFVENGSARPLTDKYNVSDISSLRSVSF